MFEQKIRFWTRWSRAISWMPPFLQAHLMKKDSVPNILSGDLFSQDHNFPCCDWHRLAPLAYLERGHPRTSSKGDQACKQTCPLLAKRPGLGCEDLSVQGRCASLLRIRVEILGGNRSLLSGSR